MTPSGSAFRKPASSLRPKSGLFFRVFIWATFAGLFLLIPIVSFVGNVGAGATLAKAQADVQALASAVDQYQAHMGAPPATLAELTWQATNARGQTAGPYLASIPTTSSGFSDYRYERHADGHWTITTTGRDSCDRPHRIEATSEPSVTRTPFIKCPGQFLLSDQVEPPWPQRPGSRTSPGR